MKQINDLYHDMHGKYPNMLINICDMANSAVDDMLFSINAMSNKLKMQAQKENLPYEPITYAVFYFSENITHPYYVYMGDDTDDRYTILHNIERHQSDIK
jgi:hypothetical protein